MPGDDDVKAARGRMRDAAGDGSVKPKGGRPGQRVTQGSKVNPSRFPNAGGANRKVDIVVQRGLRPKVTMTVPFARAQGQLERLAANKVKAKAVDAMSGDVVGRSMVVSRPGKTPQRFAVVMGE